MSDIATPKTDAAMRYTGEYSLTIDRRYPRDVEVVHIDFAREQERTISDLVNILLRLTGPFDAAKACKMPIGKVTLTHDSKMLADIRAALAKVKS